MQPLTRTFKAGTLLFRENDHSRELYIIQDGLIDVYRRIASQDVVLARLEKGAVLGEMALIDGKPRSATAKAATDCSVIMIDADTFYDKTRDVPSWFLSLIRTTSQKIRKANQRLENSFSQNVGPKIVFTLNYFIKRQPAQNGATAKFLDTNKTQSQIVQLLGITLQRVVQTLAFLQTHGLAAITDNSISVRDPARLDAYCTFLRSHLKKAFDKMPAISADHKRFLTGAAAKYPDLASGTGPAEISADDMGTVMAECGIEEEFKTVTEQFKEWGLLRIRRLDAPPREDDENPLAGYVFSPDGAAWSRWYNYYQFQNMIPNV